MNYQTSNTNTLLLVGFLLLVGLLAPVHAASLFEQYSTRNAADLNAETHEMGRQLKNYFNADDISQKQQQIDFSEYRSSLKKALLYGVSLATYSEYERDLEFARDKEVFKGLPDEIEQQGDDIFRQRADYMGKKYRRMKQNVEEEIATYSDLLLLALETCETLTRQDFTGIQDDERFIEEMRDVVNGADCIKFLARQPELAKRWPQLSQRIEAQLAVWQETAVKPDSPIIDPRIIEALL